MMPMRHGRRRRQWLALGCASLLLPLLLTGCAAPRAPITEGVAAWNGRLALSIDSDPPQSYSAGFDLHGSSLAGELLLATPLGTTLATITWSPGRAEMTQGERTTRRNSLEQLTTDLGSSAVPVAALFSWLQGQPAQAAGWQADLSRHADGRITARRTQPLPTAELRLIFEP
jgi:outer membrane lipoprotein LolB